MSAQVEIASTTEEELNGWIQVLRFAKDSNEWKLMVRSGQDIDDPVHYSEIPLLSASRALRVRALEHLPELHDALCKEVSGQAARIELEVDAAASFLDSIDDRWPS